MRVYLSSTLDDLRPERQAVKEALGGKCTVVESYIADERSVQDSCLDDVAGCDLYIGIVGRRYGFIPDGKARSITELEYQQALECNLPTLVFVKDDDEIKRNFDDAVNKENPPELIESFRQRVNSGTEADARPAIFKTPADLKVHVLRAYLHYFQRHGKIPFKRIEGRPYPGLRAFLPTESDRFFGRDVEIEALIEHLLGRDERFLAVIGPSGSGKSSLVYAGLIPALTEGPVTSGIRWIPVSFYPRELGDDPFQPLAASLTKAFPDQDWRVPDLMQRLHTHPTDIANIASEALGQDSASAQILLFVDQFEEVFAGKVDSATRNALFQMLAVAADADKCPLLRVVIAMRSDFYSQWPQDDTCITLLRSGHFAVGAPGPLALEKMIIGPAEAAELTISKRLVQRILDDTGTGSGALALAEFALSQLYDKKNGSELTKTAYDAIGGVAGSINDLAEQAVKQAGKTLRQDGRELDEELFSRLFRDIASVEQRSDAEGEALVVVRRRAAKGELPAAVLTLAQHLVDKRILVSKEGNSDQPAVFEVGHEAVFNYWKRFKDWYARYASALSLQRQAERAARDWEKAQQRPILQWGWERQLPALEALRKLNHLSVPERDAEFIDPGITTWRVVKPLLTEKTLQRFLYPEPLALLDELRADDMPHHRREEIGLRLNQLGDPRRGIVLDESGLPDIVWIDIPPGEVTLETESQERIQVPPFRLARYPITWTQYRAFLDAKDGYCNEAWWDVRPRESVPGKQLWSFANYPAINVSWYDALAYCRWLSAKVCEKIRLPTEWEWQWAAVGGTQQHYPWAGEWNAQRVNCLEAGIGRTVAVGLYPLGRSPFGIDDMAGNIVEWCLNTYQQPSNVSMDTGRVLRGGTWNDRPGRLHAATRDYARPDGRGSNIGFRVLCSPPIE